MRIALTLKRMWLEVQNTSSHLLPLPPARLFRPLCHLAALTLCRFSKDDLDRC